MRPFAPLDLLKTLQHFPWLHTARTLRDALAHARKVFLTATPHDGYTESFTALLR